MKKDNHFQGKRESKEMRILGYLLQMKIVISMFQNTQQCLTGRQEDKSYLVVQKHWAATIMYCYPSRGNNQQEMRELWEKKKQQKTKKETPN